MAIQFSTAVRTARAAAIEPAIGTSPILEIRTGSKPANCAASDSGSVLATMTLPSDWLETASNGQVTIKGTWQDLTADAGGSAGHFRVKDSGGTTCHIQGSVTATGGGGDMTLDNVVIAEGQQVTITSATFTEGNS